MTLEETRFVAALASEGVPADVINLVFRSSNTLQRLSVKACNEKLTDRDKASVENAEALISGKLSAYGIAAYFDGDPRGSVVKLVLVSGLSNGRDGLYYVPTRR